MGFNQHQRGTWVNEQAYMVHMLLGKHAKPGEGAFSLTGQPSACGTAREVGTFVHRLPADMVVDNAEHREISEKIWKLPKNTLNPKVASHYVKMMRDMEDGKMKWAWVQVNNPWQNTANANHWIKAAREMDNFIIVSDPYPGISAKVADLILPTAMIYEKWGAYGNAERRTQHWRQQVLPVGEAMSDTWQMLEFAKRFKLKEVWGEQKVDDKLTLPSVLDEAKAMGYSEEDTLFDVLFANEEAKSYPAKDSVMEDFDNSEVFGDSRKVVGSDGKVFEADIVLVAVGRGPNTAGMGYEEQGIPMDRGFVLANERLHTGVGNIYAVGDIVPGVQLAHRGYQQGIFVAEEIAGLNPSVVEDVNIPKVTFCEPEIASVGLSEAKAAEIHGKENITSAEFNVAGNAKSQILGTQGFVKLVSLKDGPILGFHAIGARMGEQVGEGQLMVSWEADADDVAACIVWTLELPAHVNIDSMVVRPRAQASNTLVARDQ